MISKENSYSLLVLAAGMGSRYGGLKQVESVGPSGETLMDYSLYDARKAGFSKVVFLIRKEMHDVFEQQIGSKYCDTMEIQYAYQAIDDLPVAINCSGDRTKPWGTGHAVWSARRLLAGKPFAVINADDFYGSATFVTLIDSMTRFESTDQESGKSRGAIMGYRLKDTLSDHGSVSRGICALDQGNLCSVEEWSGIINTVNGIEGKDSAGLVRSLTGEEVVSMNVWAFPDGVFSLLENGMLDFFKNCSDLTKDEFYLPAAVDKWITTGRAVFQSELASCKWMGVTYREDKAVVEQSIRKMIARGEYPSSLF